MTSVPSPRPVLWYTWVHGHENYHTEAMAMLLSCVAQKSPRARLRVYTDQPKWYAWLAPHVEVHVLSEAQMEQWGSKSDYLPRIKAKLIEKVSAEFEGPTGNLRAGNIPGTATSGLRRCRNSPPLPATWLLS